jgi:hypothetical protein
MMVDNHIWRVIEREKLDHQIVFMEPPYFPDFFRSASMEAFPMFEMVFELLVPTTINVAIYQFMGVRMEK